jgi:hypothetical protein
VGRHSAGAGRSTGNRNEKDSDSQMATKAGNKSAKGSSGVDWSSRVGSPMVRPSDDRSASDNGTPWALIAAVFVLCLVLIVIIPVMGLMYLEMNLATQAAVKEITKMKELRLKLLKERSNAD